MPASTLQEWRDDPGIAGSPEIRDPKKAELHDLFERVVRESVEHLVGKIESANYRDLATGIGILVDKMRLLRGQATGITESRKPLEERIAEYEQRYTRPGSRT